MARPPLDGKSAGFPLVAQSARVHRQSVGQQPETVALITSRPACELAPAPWLDANIQHWSIETGLRARLDASRHDDHCRLRRRPAVHLHSMFNRWANSLLINWRTRLITPPPTLTPTWPRITTAAPPPPSSPALSLHEYAVGGTAFDSDRLTPTCFCASISHCSNLWRNAI